MSGGQLTFALPKGRILGPATALLRSAGVDLGEVGQTKDRRLMFDRPGGGRVLLVKPSDVPTYVEHGVADVGVVGSDTLREQSWDLYEPVDLGLGACRLAVAEARDRPARLRRGMALRVATKYPNLTRRHYRSRGISPEIIPLYGSVELGAITGLADQIVDLVESGETLRQNRLVEVETLMHVTSRLIVHPASLKRQPASVAQLIDALRAAVGDDAANQSPKAVATP
ncbi:MAG: ATP phosphoribosyltransferase [Deltaproteobacteria bacterium]|nr:ATP phosphoribosyltransferase [Deltaproteobacteria bacterium]